MNDCLGSFEWRTLQLTTCERILRTSNNIANDAFGDQNNLNLNDEIAPMPTRKRNFDEQRPAPSFDLQELFATMVEVQTLPSLLLPRYTLLVSDLTSLRHCRVEFWCDCEKSKNLFPPKKKKKKINTLSQGA